MKLSIRTYTYFIFAAIACLSLQVFAEVQECAAGDAPGSCEDPSCPR
jgi:hypothetical protein